MNPSQPVSSHISGVEFGFLSAADVRTLSVKRITNPTTFDSLLHPVPGGLHDAALGSFLDNPCSTCGLTTMLGCPGHCGHIELPVPVYHLTFMDQLLRLLRGKCGYCHQFKLARVTINEYVSKLRLIRCGLVQEASEMHERIDATKGKTNKNVADSEDSDEDGADIIGQRNSYVKRCLKRSGISSTGARSVKAKTEAISEARRQVVKDFYANVTVGKKCRNCGGVNPTFRKDRGIKLFRKTLSAKEKGLMAQQEKRLQNPLELLARREAKSSKQQVHEDEGIADLDPASEGEDVEMQEADGTLVASESMARTAKQSSSSRVEDSVQEYMTAAEVKAAMVLLFEHEAELLRLLYSPNSKARSQEANADMFFIHAVIVPPNRYRMEDKTGDSIAESPKNSLYKGILNACDSMRQISNEMKGQDNELGYRRRNFGDLQTSWVNLQGSVNALIDRDANPIQGLAGRTNADGIKQHLEKKEGLFRKNMMGKRVNFAARSVISPDPNIETTEIGVPPVFAKKLTYPEPVTNHNFYELKEAVLNGPDKWPGAVAIENEFGQVIALRKKNYEERLALANQLLAPSSTVVNGSNNKKVHRHLNNGDMVIMNRQPTLHKPSMMAHRARVLPGEKTIRMHYSNCNTYNADFDGDEMNMHFPQNALAQAEAQLIANTDNQYLSATAGKPLRGLIQDHVSMGVWLSNKDTFFNREDYHQLLYASLRPEDGHTTGGERILTVPPAIWKPRPLWTGKQLITTVLKNIKPSPKVEEDGEAFHYQGLTLTSKSQTAAKLWGVHLEEMFLILKDGEVISGILDKGQIGPSSGGLVNGVFEAYGPTVAGRFLSVVGRLLTKFLHMRALSCGVEDLILTKEGDEARLASLKGAENIGFEVASKYVTLDSKKITPNNVELRRRLESVLRDEPKHRGLDMLSSGAVAKISTAVTDSCLPHKLIKTFPQNQMQAMTGSGAKGSMVNANQISCNLGQQALEGRRVPVMISGKTLPCFKPYETSVRAGGYIVNRFLTGIRPQEYYFHTMAGREGLIDTAVKTSRSGYLQRCIIKGMEGLKVEYDTSVRDSDGSMVQFLYGEDGVDTTRQKYLNDFKFQAENFASLSLNLNAEAAYSSVACPEASEHNKSALKKVRKTLNVAAADPALALYTPSRYCGSTSEKFYTARREYTDANPDKLIKGKKREIQDKLREILKKNFDVMMDLKYLRSLVEPGEAVGVVAGQSIGEPSTQMTLNTFHLAGHAAKNVTLGIPRLREIVMTASAKISTPSMKLFPHPEMSTQDYEKFAKSISRLPLSAVIDKVTVTEELGPGTEFSQARKYMIRLDLYPAKEYTEEYAIKVRDVADSIEKKFCPRMQKIVKTDIKKKGESKSLSTAKSAALPTIGESFGNVEQQTVREPEADNEGGIDDEESDGGEDEGDATNEKQRGRRQDSVEFQAPEDEEQAFADNLDKGDASEDETYGGSPKPSRAGTPESDQDDDSDDELLVPVDEISSIRESRVYNTCTNITSFKFDDKQGAYCEITFEFHANIPKLLMLHHVESAVDFATIHVIPGITSAVVNTKDSSTGDDLEEPTIETEGSNLIAMRDYPHIIDPTRIFTNDIVAMLNLYGVEACRATIVREMAGVFGGHGISVDNRHLNLIADTMTKGGGFTPFNRNGLKANPSPFMKMSFETTVGFLKDAVLERDWDDLSNPSSRIVVGRLGKMGTGGFDVLAPVRVRDPLKGVQEEEEEEEGMGMGIGGLVGGMGGESGLGDGDGDGDVEMGDASMQEEAAAAQEQEQPLVEEAEGVAQGSPMKEKKKKKKHRRSSE